METHRLNSTIELAINRTLDEYRRMELMLELYKKQIDDDVRRWIIEAYTISDTWDYRVHSDGCTGVSECHSPKGFKFPPCVMHDYLRERFVKTGKMSVDKCDWLFYKAHWQFGSTKFRAFIRASFVRTVAWWFWFKWQK